MHEAEVSWSDARHLDVVLFRLGGADITTFNVLAGAVALGIGFGRQNIISNFVSGLIIMIERRCGTRLTSRAETSLVSEHNFEILHALREHAIKPA
jgi:small-conductance mechanosensitive channel